MKPISTGSRARSIGIPNSEITTKNCPTISTTRNIFQFRTRESSISASLWSWISLVSSYPTTTTKFATSSAEEALTADIRICWCGGAPSTCGTIFRIRPRKRPCGSGARRTGSTSVGPEVTLLLSAGGVDESAGYPGIRPALVQSCTDRPRKAGLAEHDENYGTKSSNPLPSSEESGANRDRADQRSPSGLFRHFDNRRQLAAYAVYVAGTKGSNPPSS